MSLWTQVKPERLLVLGIPVMAAVVVVLVLAWGHAAAQSAEAEEPGAPEMSLEVVGAASCDSADNPTECTVDANADFNIVVSGPVLPEGGISGFSSEVVGVCGAGTAGVCPAGGLVYQPQAACIDEVIVRITVRAGEQTIPGAPPPICNQVMGGAGQPRHGGGSATRAPFSQLEDETGDPAPPLPLVKLNVNCAGTLGSHEVVLVDLTSSPFGAAYFDVPDGIVVSVKTVGTRNLDRDGDGELDTDDDTGELIDYAITDALEINCGAAAQPTATSDGPGPGEDTPTPGEATAFPPTGSAGGIDASGGGTSAGVWVVIGALLAAAAAGLAVFGWRYARGRQGAS